MPCPEPFRKPLWAIPSLAILLGTLASVLLGALIGGVGGALLAILGLVQVPHGAAG